MMSFRKGLGCFFLLIGVIDLLCDFLQMLRTQTPGFAGILGVVVGVCIMGMGAVLIEESVAGTMDRWVFIMISVLKGQSAGQPSWIDTSPSPKEINVEIQKHNYVIGADKPPPPPDEWNTSLREVLHQASLYSTPTYYLDRNLNIIDWNLAFETLFAEIVSSLRSTHVNWFISKLGNPERVFHHAKEFSQINPLPMIDSETLYYTSRVYGLVQMVKFAVQLHDEHGEERGWTVALYIRRIGDWTRFREDIQLAFKNNKIWSYYGASYDKVLLEYPPYLELQKMVAGAVPRGNFSVADIGAGTGNTTRTLLDRGHRVWAVENNVVMLDCLRNKELDMDRVQIIKSSVEHLEILAEQSRKKPFDAVVSVNVLYTLKDPLACLKSLNRLMKTGGILAFSTTHSETRLGPLLADIKTTLVKKGSFDELEHDYDCVYTGNRMVEEMARQHSREQYLKWAKKAGFKVRYMSPTEYPDKRIGAVMVVHAIKVAEPEADDVTEDSSELSEPMLEDLTPMPLDPLSASSFPYPTGHSTGSR